MKTQMLTCALLASTASLAMSQGASSELPSPRNAAPVRVANPPPAPLVGGSDTCTTPDVITGTGSFPFDNSIATTGPEGQSTLNCIFYNLIAINTDVWFVWTAPSSGTVEVMTCGGTTTDTKMAAYLYAGSCPAPATNALSCNDDMSAYFLPSKLVFNVTAGQQILIQIGLYPGAPAPIPGPGNFAINYVPPAVSGCVTYDDGFTNNALTVTPSVAGGTRTTGWMHRYGLVGDVTTVTDVQTAWGWTGTGSPLPAGLIGNVGLWDDPNDDGDPSDAVLLAQASAPMVNQHTDMFQAIPLPSPTVANGVFFVGAWVTHVSGFPSPMDLNSCEVRDGDAWFMGDNAGNFQPANLSAGTTPPTRTGALGAAAGSSIGPGFEWLLRATCSTGGGGSTGTPFCPGDGTGTACPCANNSPAGAGEGCLNSLGTGGKLRATGAPSIANDTLVLNGTQMANSSCLYFQGTLQQAGGAGSVFGDGKRCAGGSVIRLKTKTNVGGSSNYPEAGDLSVSVKGAITAPGIRTYQAWYRNAAAFCTTSTFNLTNGLEVNWTP